MSSESGTTNTQPDGGISLTHCSGGIKFSVQTQVITSITGMLPPENPENHMAAMTPIEGMLKKRPANIDDIKKTMNPEIFDLLIRDFPDMLMLPPKNHEKMSWYQEFISRESHPENNRVKGLILGLSDDEEERERQILQYARDYEDFYERRKSCIAKIALKGGPLFVYFGSYNRDRFQNMVGVLSDKELLDTDFIPINNMFLYSMSEIA